MSCCEIYNENIVDLMRVRREGEMVQMKKVKEREFSSICYDSNNDIFYIKELIEKECRSINEVYEDISKALSYRQSRCNAVNSRSSRSHCIVTFTFHLKENQIKKKGKLCIVDLAGNERIKNKYDNTTVGINETKAINKSLFTLGQVINLY